MSVKDLVRPLPGVRRISILRQQLAFRGSGSFWEQNYAGGDTSGPGSYGMLGEGKANFINNLVRTRNIESVIEFGCGDGHQLSLADYPSYVGLDVSPTAIGLCKNKFIDDSTKSFFLYDGQSFVDRSGRFTADLAMSLDVIYHLIEDVTFENYMAHLFAAGDRFVLIYSTNGHIPNDAPHVRHRPVTAWIEQNCADWRLAESKRGPDSGPGRADFFLYERIG
jgi:SAM-dependent methyltransferase